MTICLHKNYTVHVERNGKKLTTYKVCNDCGTELR